MCAVASGLPRGPQRSPGETTGLSSGSRLGVARKSALLGFALGRRASPHSLLQSQAPCKTRSHPAPPHFSGSPRRRGSLILLPPAPGPGRMRGSLHVFAGETATEKHPELLPGGLLASVAPDRDTSESDQKRFEPQEFLARGCVSFVSRRFLHGTPGRWAGPPGQLLSRSPLCPERLPSVCLPSLTSESPAVFG